MTNNKSKRAARLQRNAQIVKRMWWTFASVMALLLLLFILIYNGVIGYMPAIDQLKNPTDKFASTIYAAGGEEMGRYYR